MEQRGGQGALYPKNGEEVLVGKEDEDQRWCMLRRYIRVVLCRTCRRREGMLC